MSTVEHKPEQGRSQTTSISRRIIRLLIPGRRGRTAEWPESQRGYRGDIDKQAGVFSDGSGESFSKRMFGPDDML